MDHKLYNFEKCLLIYRHAKRELAVPRQKDSPFGFFCSFKQKT